MKRQTLVLTTVATVCLGLIAVPAEASSTVTFTGGVNVPGQMPNAAEPDAGPPTVELLVEPSWEVQRAAEIRRGDVVGVVGRTGDRHAVVQLVARPGLARSSVRR
jgi:hypothetical protein